MILNKEEFIRFRVTAEEKMAIQQKALASYSNLSTYVRDAALGKEIVSMHELEEVSVQLRRIGHNLNQLTVLSRQGKVRAFGLEDTREEVAKLWQSVNSYLQNLQ